MPRFPDPSAGVRAMPGSVFSALAHRLATYDGEVYPFHVGDTWLEPAVGCRMQDLSVDDHPGMHRYAPPRGIAPLLDAVAAYAERSTGVPTGPDDVLITAGATGALGAAVGALADPGDEVLVLAPFWPLITGIVRSFHAVPVVVPFIGAVEALEQVEPTLERHRSDRTVALYVGTPNNPTGRVLPRAWLEAIAAWAARHDLWLLADDVYEQYAYRGDAVPLRAVDPARTIAAGSCSKAWGMAGNRCGWAIGPATMIGELCKISTHAFYSCPSASQLAAVRAFDGAGEAWVREVRPQYVELGRIAAQRLGVDEPDGGQFLFVDVAERLDERGLLGFLERCAARGLFLAPGPSFGPYPTHVRLCFTAAPPEVTRRGLDVLAEMLGR